MHRTHGSKQLSLYYVLTLTALLAKYKLARLGDDLRDETEVALHDIYVVSNPNEEQF